MPFDGVQPKEENYAWLPQLSVLSFTMLYLQNIAFLLTCTLNNLLRFQIAKWLREMYNLETQCRLNNWKLIISKAHEEEPIKHVLSIKSNFSFQSVTERKGYRL